MNKNPTRPENMNEILSQTLNPKETELDRYKRIQKEILQEVFVE